MIISTKKLILSSKCRNYLLLSLTHVPQNPFLINFRQRLHQRLRVVHMSRSTNGMLEWLVVLISLVKKPNTLMGTRTHNIHCLLENFFKKMSSLNCMDCSKGDILLISSYYTSTLSKVKNSSAKSFFVSKVTADNSIDLWHSIRGRPR